MIIFLGWANKQTGEVHTEESIVCLPSSLLSLGVTARAICGRKIEEVEARRRSKTRRLDLEYPKLGFMGII